MKKRKNSDSKKNQMYYIARYSGLAFEMLGIIVLGVFVGLKLDEKFSFEFPIFSLIFSLLGIFSSLYFVIKGVLKKD